MSTRRSYTVRIPLIVLVLVALSVAGTASHAQPTDPDAARGYRLLEAGSVDAAEDAFEQSLEKNPSGRALLGLARVSIARSDWSEAGRRLENALEADPEPLEAHYWNGITHRELAKYQTFNQAQHRETSESEFRFVIAADSSFQDVFYQYALLERYHEQHERAIQLAELQLRVRPELAAAWKGTFDIYRHYAQRTAPEEALAFLEASDSHIAEFFAAEVLRREGRLEEAALVLDNLLKGSAAERAIPVQNAIDPPPAPPQEADAAEAKADAGLPVQPLLLALARIRYSQGKFDEAESFVEEAVERIGGRHDAAFLFDDFKYIVDRDELDLYGTLEHADELKAFFRYLWVRRDPTPARSYNTRLAEHYRRLLVAEEEYVYEGFRLWHNDPDRLNQLSFPATYDLNDEFNDKGLIYIRHGEPDDREVQVGDDMDFRSVRGDVDPFYIPGEQFYTSAWLPNESWRYHTPEQMDFHFVLAEGGRNNNWRLVPVLTNYQMVLSREHWGARYFQLARAAEIMSRIQENKVPQTDASSFGVSSLDQELSEEEAARVDSALSQRRINYDLMDEHMRSVLEYQEIRNWLVEESRRDIELALQTDQHTWEEEIETIDVPYMVSAFRGEDGQTEVEVDFALPLGRITEQAGSNATVDVEVGYSVHDEAWRPVSEEAEVKHLPTAPDPSAASIDFFRFTVAPGRYNLSLFGKPVNTVQMGGYKFEYEAPDYSGRLLEMSDLLIADFIGPARSGSRFDRGDLHVSPNPFLRFSNAQPVYVYFEIYNLTLAGDDETNFSIDYILQPERPRPKFLGIFGGGDRPAVTITEERTGAELSPIEYAGIDVQAVDPGPYVLTVRVTDRVTGRVVERSRPLELYTYEQ